MRHIHSTLFSIFAVLAALVLAGCSGTQAITQAAEAVITPASEQAGEVTYVQVQSIDGSTITGLVGTLNQPSGDNGGSQPQGTPPEQPSGENGGSQPQGTPPDQPSGDSGSSQGNPPQSAAGQPGNPGFTAGEETITFTAGDATSITTQNGDESADATLADIAAGDILAVTFSGDNVAESIAIQQTGAPDMASQAGGQPGSGFGGSATVTNGTSANSINTDTTVTGETYSSGGDDENALRVDGATAALNGITVNKTGGESSNTGNGDFYGQNAGLLALNGATVTITGATITTNAVNGNGVFSYGEGTTVGISDSVIRTSQNNSGGIQTTGGGTTNATNLDVQTEGASSAAIRSDRGGGTVNAVGGTYVTNGTGSPAIYSTANITVSDATLTANASEAVVVEGKNSVTLNNVTLSGNMQAGTDTSENVHNIMLYQSMSGDAEVGHSSFAASGGSILANAGVLFYVTNTTCTISLENVALTLANGTLLTVSGNSSSRGWGTQGANGGVCTFTASNQQLAGTIVVDEISSLDLSLDNGTVFTGAINPGGAAGTVGVTLSSGTSWVLTGNSYITSFSGDVGQIETNGYSVFVNGTAITK
ncbi:MAG: proline-rich domain-containing protein [Eubacteriales bacterium]|nr:proline-rich domain-containing protein [Eubacteriales bacterium]